jgi:hypothetical protein
MTTAGISWYLCALFLVAAVVTSAITVVPGGESAVQTQAIAAGGLSLTFAIIALATKLLGVAGPRWLLRVFQGVAVLASLVVLLMLVG